MVHYKRSDGSICGDMNANGSVDVLDLLELNGCITSGSCVSCKKESTFDTLMG